jgi:hypothetical protein
MERESAGESNGKADKVSADVIEEVLRDFVANLFIAFRGTVGHLAGPQKLDRKNPFRGRCRRSSIIPSGATVRGPAA